MVEILTLQAQRRDIAGRKTDELRAQNIIPAVLYGFETEPVSIQLSRSDFTRMYQQAGESTVVELEIDGKKHHVLIQDTDRDPLTDDFIHADFRQINMNEKVETTINIKLTGVAPAVKDLGGTLVQSLEEVEVLALPSALVREITVDVSGLKTFDDSLRVRDIQIPEGIEILTDMDSTLAVVQEPQTEEQFAAQEAAAKEAIEGVAKQEEEIAKAKAAEQEASKEDK